MNQAIMLAVIIGASLSLVAVVASGAGDLVITSMFTGSIDVTHQSVVDFDGKTYVMMTIKNTGMSTITNADVIVKTADGLVGYVSFTENIKEGNSSSIDEILKDESGTNIITQTGEVVLISTNATTVDGSVITVAPVKLRVK